MNEEWLLYAVRNEAYTRKWKGTVRRTLNRQLRNYVETLQSGRGNLAAFDAGEIYEVLRRIHGNVGDYYGRTTSRDIARQIKPVAAISGKAFIPGYKTKRGVLGFSIDWANKIIDKLRISGLNMAIRIAETTKRKVLLILGEAQNLNLSLDETVKRLLSEVQGLNKSRAETITRTEVGRAAGEGKMEGARSLGVAMDKIWLSATDFRTRRNPKRDPKAGDHWVLNEQRKPFDEPFSNGVHLIMQPGDKKAPASEIVNCRCTVAFKVKRDAQGEVIRKIYVDDPGGNSSLSAEIQQAVRDVTRLVPEKPSTGFPRARTVAEAEDYARKTFGLKDRVVFDRVVKGADYSKFSVDLANNINEKVTELHKKYGAIMKAINGDMVNEGAFGSAGLLQRDLRYNGNRMNDVEAYVQKVGGAVRVGSNAKIDEDTYRMKTITHEYGHLVAAPSMIKQRVSRDKAFLEVHKEWQKLVSEYYKKASPEDKKILGSYADKNEDELFAEAFTHFELSGEKNEWAVKFMGWYKKHEKAIKKLNSL